MKNKKDILLRYLVCALWTAELDEHTVEEVSKKSEKQAIKDIDLFVEKAGSLLDGLTDEQIGYDFWLTRNGHGAGFWDRNLGEVGEKLTAICKEFRGLDVFPYKTKIIIE